MQNNKLQLSEGGKEIANLALKQCQFLVKIISCLLLRSGNKFIEQFVLILPLVPIIIRKLA